MARLAGTALLVLIALTAAIYAPVRSHPFVYEDARVWVALDSPLTWSSVHLPGRVVAQASYVLTNHVGPISWPHVGTVVLHLLTGALVFALAWQVAGVMAAPIAAGAFLLHPLNSEAVNYLAARPDVLLTLCIVLGLVLALAPWGAWRWLLVAVSLLAAALTKQTGIAGVPLLLLTMWTFQRERARLLPWVLLLLTIGLLLWHGPLWASTAQAGQLPWGLYLRIQNAAVWNLLRLTFARSGFTIDHDPAAIAPALQHLALVATAALFALAAWAWSRRPLLAWGLGWLVLSVCLRFTVQAGGWINEPHLYLGNVGLSVLFGAGCAALLSPRPVPSQKAVHA